MKKLSLILASAVFLTGLVPVQPAIATTDCSSPAADVFAAGDGSLSDPYQVDDLAALDEMRCYLDKNFVLIADIEISEGHGGAGGWTPIGAASPNEFTGTFDGAGYQITGLVIDAKQNSANPEDVGLFGQLRTARLSNLVFGETTVIGSESCGTVGTLVGTAEYSLIENITLTDSTLTASCSVGGLVGSASRSSLKDLVVNSTVNVVPNSSGDIGNGLGGLIGRAIESSIVGVTLESQVLISGNETTPGFIGYVGGVAGEGRDTIFNRMSVDSLIEATTNSTVQFLGGIAGSASNVGHVSNSDLKTVIDLIEAGGSNQVSCIAPGFGYSSSANDLSAVCDLSVGDNAQGIGAGFREIDDGANITRVQLHANLTIGQDPTEVGFISARADTAYISNSVFTGSMTFAPSSSATSVGLVFGAGSGSRMPIRASQTILAIETNLDEMTGTDVGKAVGADSASETRVPALLGVLIDQSLLGYELASARLDVERATTSELQSSSYLATKGFDLEDVWQQAAGEYPKLRFGPKVVIETITLSPTIAPLQLRLQEPGAAAVSSGTLAIVSNYNLVSVSVRLADSSRYLFTKTTANGFEILIPSDLPAGSHHLIVSSPGGTAVIQDAIKVESEPEKLQVSIRRNQDDSVRIFAKNVVGEGKIQFYLNGKEIAWIRAANGSDPKIRSTPLGEYLVRVVNLVPGKNVIEVSQDGERLRRVAYTR